MVYNLRVDFSLHTFTSLLQSSESFDDILIRGPHFEVVNTPAGTWSTGAPGHVVGHASRLVELLTTVNCCRPSFLINSIDRSEECRWGRNNAKNCVIKVQLNAGHFESTFVLTFRSVRVATLCSSSDVSVWCCWTQCDGHRVGPARAPTVTIPVRGHKCMARARVGLRGYNRYYTFNSFDYSWFICYNVQASEHRNGKGPLNGGCICTQSIKDITS